MYYLEKMFTVIISAKEFEILHTGFNVIKSDLILSESSYYSFLPKTQEELVEEFKRVLNGDFDDLEYHYIPKASGDTDGYVITHECSKYKEITRDEYYLYEDIINQHDSLTLKFKK